MEKSGFGAALKIHILATYKFTIASFLEEVAIMMSENVWMQHKFLGRKRRKKCNAKGRFFFFIRKKRLFACHFTWIGPVFTFLFCLDFAKEVFTIKGENYFEVAFEFLISLKFRYCEKATQLEKIFHFILKLFDIVKAKWKIFTGLHVAITLIF